MANGVFCPKASLATSRVCSNFLFHVSCALLSSLMAAWLSLILSFAFPIATWYCCMISIWRSDFSADPGCEAPPESKPASTAVTLPSMSSRLPLIVSESLLSFSCAPVTPLIWVLSSETFADRSFILASYSGVCPEIWRSDFSADPRTPPPGFAPGTIDMLLLVHFPCMRRELGSLSCSIRP